MKNLFAIVVVFFVMTGLCFGSDIKQPTGNVTGTAPTVVNNLASWNNTTATGMSDSGIASGPLVDNGVQLGLGGRNAGNYPAQIVPQEVGAKVFNLAMTSISNPGDTALDQVMSFGVNEASGGARYDGSRGALWDGWESHWCPTIGDAVNCFMERHVGQFNVGGNIGRPYTFTVNESNGAIAQSFHADTMDWNIGRAGAQAIVWTAANNTMDYDVPMVLRFNTNNYVPIQQANTTGGLISFMKVNASNQIQLAPGGDPIYTTAPFEIQNALIMDNSTGVIQWKDHLGVAHTVFSLDSGDTLRIKQTSNNNFIIAPGSGGQIRVTTNNEGTIIADFNDNGNTTFGSNTNAGYRVDVQGTLRATGLATLNNALFTAAAPTVAASQVGLGGTVTANTNCGTLASSAGCLVINVAGTTRYIPYY